ncbi:MAG TPA: DUF4468 domain-containing protein [Pedobacter sp.]|nr:DUF4468 domain-containing protein [Pedobacter sp.]
MRLLIITACLLFAASAFAQESYFDKSRIPVVNSQIQYALIDTAKNLSKADIFSLVSQWASNKVSQKANTIQLNDKDGGKLITRVSIPSSHFITVGRQNIPINFTIQMILDFTCKDSKYRLIINNLSIEIPATMAGNKLIDRTVSSYDTLLSNFPTADEYKTKPKSEQQIYQHQSKYLNTMHTEVLSILTSVKEFIRKGNTVNEL